MEIELARAVGENLPAAVRGETVILEHMMANNVLNDVYTRGLGFGEYSHFLSEAIVQLGHRYPHMNILEIGMCCPRFPPMFFVRVQLLTTLRRRDWWCHQAHHTQAGQGILLVYLYGYLWWLLPKRPGRFQTLE